MQLFPFQTQIVILWDSTGESKMSSWGCEKPTVSEIWKWNVDGLSLCPGAKHRANIAAPHYLSISATIWGENAALHSHFWGREDEGWSHWSER